MHKKVFFTSDPHFFHESIIRLCHRPFKSVHEMNETLIEKSNSVVGKDDILYILGDFAYWKGISFEQIKDIFNRLNGEKHLIIGNHDNQMILSLPWKSKNNRVKLKLTYDGYILDKNINDERKGEATIPWILDHYSIRSWEGAFHGSWHIYGHTHNSIQGVGRSTDVGVDSWNYLPVSVEQIRERVFSENPNYEIYQHILHGRTEEEARKEIENSRIRDKNLNNELIEFDLFKKNK